LSKIGNGSNEMSDLEIRVEQRTWQELFAQHELYRAEANCQLIRDSHWARGFLNCYAIDVDGQRAGHGAVAERYDKGRVLEFYTFPEFRRIVSRLFHDFLMVSGPTHIEAQSNVPVMLALLKEFGKEMVAERFLFADGGKTRLACPLNGIFRQLKAEGELTLFHQGDEPPGDWVIEAEGKIVATGGYLTHYNPPYADLHMEVEQSQRRMGFGSYLIQELKRVCFEDGYKPAARCNYENVASRRTLERGGMKVCGEVLVATVRHSAK
jgi:GNAT superfamily N-acetyltransferase